MTGIFFSGTGNSRHTVEVFCEKYGENPKVISIEDDDIIAAIKQDEFLVFAYPVQYSMVPKILYDFINDNNKLWNNKKIFIIDTE